MKYIYMKNTVNIILVLSIFLLTPVDGSIPSDKNVPSDQNIVSLLKPSYVPWQYYNSITPCNDSNVVVPLSITPCNDSNVAVPLSITPGNDSNVGVPLSITPGNDSNMSIISGITHGNDSIYATIAIFVLIFISVLYMKNRRKSRTTKHKVKDSQIEKDHEFKKGIIEDEKEQNKPSLYPCIEQNIGAYPYSVGKSMIGPDHVKNDMPCQDRCGYKTLSSGVGIIVVADGLGSRSKSDMGASVAVNSIINFIDTTILNDQNKDIEYNGILKDAIFFARKSLENCAIEKQCNFNDLACTIIVVIVHEDSIVVAHIGDGAVVAKTKKGITLISGPGKSEYVNEPEYLTSEKWESFLRISQKISNVECVATFTDGCQGSCLGCKQDGYRPYDRFFELLFSGIRNVVQRADGIMICKNDINNFVLQQMNSVSEDDKTIVVSILR